jgi:hypothetical protein
MLTAEQLAALPKDRRKEVEKTLRQLEDLRRDDPLAFFHACPSNCGVPGCVPHPHQHEFLLAKTKTQAVFAGNRFGKTTALVVKCLIQHYPKDRLPDRLKPYRFVTHDRPVRGRLMCPSEDSLQGYVIPKVQEWVPQHLLLGKSWAKAYSKQHGVLHFADGGLLEFRTYKVDPATLVGADLDYVANDEPSPEPHAKENWWRLIDRNGKMIHALTPVNMTGGGIGWLYRDVYKKRDSEHITVIQGAIHDNAHLDAAEVKLTLESATEKEREAREFGRFVHMGGMVYDGGFEGVLMRRDPYDREEDRRFIQRLDVVVGMDPGLKNAAFTWVGFDADNRAYVFDEVLLQEKTPTDYANALRRTNAKWGIKDPLYVIDPSARNRSLTNAESVEALLQAQGHLPDARLQPRRGRHPADPPPHGEGHVLRVSLLPRAARRGGGVPHGRPAGWRVQGREGERPPPRQPALRDHYTPLGPADGLPHGSSARLEPREGPVSSTTRGCVRRPSARSEPAGLHVLKGTPCASSRPPTSGPIPVPSTRSSAGTMSRASWSPTA